MRTTILSFFMLLAAAVSAQGSKPAPLSIIPEPVEVKQSEGQFTISRATRIYASDKEAEKSAKYFIDYFNRHFGYELAMAKKDTGDDIIVLSHEKNKEISGGYTLKVSPEKIVIKGNDGPGVFYGMQTLIQLLPTRAGILPIIGAVEIKDYPRFEYRGMHMDVVRHFFPVEYLCCKSGAYSWRKAFGVHIEVNLKHF